MSLTTADLKTVYVTTFAARNKWRNILLVLDVSPATIESIGVQFRDNPDDCYRKGLAEWLNAGERHWRDMVEALSSPVVGHKDMARAIERDYTQSVGSGSTAAYDIDSPDSSSGQERLKIENRDVPETVPVQVQSQDEKSALLVAMFQSRDCGKKDEEEATKVVKGATGLHTIFEVKLTDAEEVDRDLLIKAMVQSRSYMYGKEEATKVGKGATGMDHPPLSLKLEKRKDLPISCHSSIQCVAIDEAVFVGGGTAIRYSDSRTVMMLDLQQDQWTKLPQYNAERFAMTAFDKKLILIGGWVRKGLQGAVKEVAVFESESGKWLYLYPPLNIARYGSTAVSYKNHIVVCGGIGGNALHTTLSSVEVLDMELKIWHTADPLPHPWTKLQSTILASTLYVMGGVDDDSEPTARVCKANLNDLIGNTTPQKAEQASSTLWQSIEDTPYERSAPLGVGGHLLAIGGEPTSPTSKRITPIYLYQPDTKRWVKVETVENLGLSNCTCTQLNGNIFMTGYDMPCNPVYFLSLADSI